MCVFVWVYICVYVCARSSFIHFHPQPSLLHTPPPFPLQNTTTTTAQTRQDRRHPPHLLLHHPLHPLPRRRRRSQAQEAAEVDGPYHPRAGDASGEIHGGWYVRGIVCRGLLGRFNHHRPIIPLTISTTTPTPTPTTPNTTKQTKTGQPAVSAAVLRKLAGAPSEGKWGAAYAHFGGGEVRGCVVCGCFVGVCMLCMLCTWGEDPRPNQPLNHKPTNPHINTHQNNGRRARRRATRWTRFAPWAPSTPCSPTSSSPSRSWPTSTPASTAGA